MGLHVHVTTPRRFAPARQQLFVLAVQQQAFAGMVAETQGGPLERDDVNLHPRYALQAGGQLVDLVQGAVQGPKPDGDVEVSKSAPFSGRTRQKSERYPLQVGPQNGEQLTRGDPKQVQVLPDLPARCRRRWMLKVKDP